MGILMMLARKMQLQDTKNNLEYQITALNTKKEDLIKYSSILAQDSISAVDIASIPPSLFMQGMGELAGGHMYAEQVAQNNFNQAMSSGLFGDGSDPYVQNLTMQKMYEDARKEYQKMISAKLNEQEKAAAAKATRLQALLSNTEKELEFVDQRLAKDAETSVSGYGIRA